MLYRSTVTIICLGTLQISAVNDSDIRQKAATTACIQTTKPDCLAQLPTSEPTTPKTPKHDIQNFQSIPAFLHQQKVHSLRRVQTDGDFLISKTEQRKKIKAEKIKQISHFLQQLISEQLVQEKELRVEEKRVAAAWQKSIKDAEASRENYRVTHAYTYFPHSGTVCETSNSETEYHVPNYHMDF